jgi:hypothetical protein
MDEKDAAIDALAAAAIGRGEIGPAVSRAFAVAKASGAEGSTRMLARLDRLIRTAPVGTVGNVALLAGALVENGADGAAFPSSLFDRLGAFLDDVPEPPLSHDHDADEDEDDDDDDEDGGSSVLPESYYLCERAAAAMLSRSATARRSLRQKAWILGKIRRYQERYGFLGKMLSVLDDEPLWILHPSTRRGWRARFGGIADNFQFHALLRAALAGPGDDRIAGTPPDPRSTAANTDALIDDPPKMASDWQLAQWRAIQPDGSIPGKDDTRHWIWNEGFPAEIEPFEGTRVVAVGPSSIQRSWNAGRIFDGMHGWLTVDGRLTADDVASLLDRIAIAARRPSAPRT